MKTVALILVFMILFWTGCLPAVSTIFESARMLVPKSIEIQGTGSLYAGYLSKRQDAQWGLRSSNFGLNAAYGLSNKLNIRARYEQYRLEDRAEFVKGPLLASGTVVSYSEILLKYGWTQSESKAKAALTLPVGIFTYPGGASIYIAPAVFATYVKSNKFEVTLNGKLHFWLNGLPSYPWASFGFGLGLSQNLNRWALRPEIGYDLFNVSLGLGFSYIFSK